MVFAVTAILMFFAALFLGVLDKVLEFWWIVVPALILLWFALAAWEFAPGHPERKLRWMLYTLRRRERPRWAQMPKFSR